MKALKNRFGILLCLGIGLCLLLGSTALAAEEPVAAASQVEYGYITVTEYDAAAPIPAAQYEAFLAAVTDGWQNHRTTIDISAANVTEDLLGTLWQKAKFAYPEYFHVPNGFGYYSNGGKVTSVLVEYTMTASEYATARAEYDRLLAEITDQMDPAWTDLQKVLFAHDYIAVLCEYDLTYTYHDAVTMLTDHTGVCEAYTRLFTAILRTCGIETDVVISDPMVHAWSAVKLDGEWYHVDVTWDDPVLDRLGRSQHINFLRSDAGIEEAGHYGYVSDHACTDTTYDNAFWQDVDTRFVCVGGKWYYLTKNGDLCVWHDTATAGTPVKHFSDLWWVIGGGGAYWPGFHSGLSAFDGRVILNDSQKVYAYDIGTSEVEVLYTNTDATRLIFGSNVVGNTLYVLLEKDPNTPGLVVTETLTKRNGGKCGTNLEWQLEDGLLVISGTGAMNNYAYSDGVSTAPWFYRANEITEVHVTGGTSIGAAAFAGCSGITGIHVTADTVTAIGTDAFRDCAALEEVTFMADPGQWTAALGSGSVDAPVYCLGVNAPKVNQAAKTVEATILMHEEAHITAVCALYDAHGRFVQFKTVNLTGKGGKATFTGLNLGGAASVKILAMDQQQKPVYAPSERALVS